MTDGDSSRFDQRLRRARRVTLLSLATNAWAILFLPGIGLWREPRAVLVVLGAVGVGGFAIAQWGALYAVVTPWLAEPIRRRLLIGFAVAAVFSVVLVGPVAGGRWATWAWLGASIVGTAPLLVRRRWAVAVALIGVTVSAGIAWQNGDSIRDHLLITGGVGLGIAAVAVLQVWFWDLLVRAEQGRSAQARLSATEERLRFARDVHDLLGHNLSVIALKAELAARLASTDAVRAGREAAEVRRLAASALTELREVVHGYRVIDLPDQLATIGEVLRTSGVRCTISESAGELPPEVVAQLAAVLREAGTNVLRHSAAAWCTIEMTRHSDEVRLTVANDGADGAKPDPHSFGLRGLADRLAESGGLLRTREEGGVFTLDAVVRVPA